jgi:hypothetical protein
LDKDPKHGKFGKRWVKLALTPYAPFAKRREKEKITFLLLSFPCLIQLKRQEKDEKVGKRKILFS